ncbi:hypothetical protein [Thermolongibacillus altinsuensis]|uniref:hypothetical protein n=1 Tax=Thermolongibacillus altinsuensis TaxID=575256 RepID=UPI0014052C7A|nr:hypothetical protein [Thermolongibacillus altinsuensis]
MPPWHASSVPIPNVKRMTDKFICLMTFSFGEVAEKLVHIGKSRLSYIKRSLFIRRGKKNPYSSYLSAYRCKN